ncbi:PH, RCC1 and FYVE domains-containing protein 1 [Zea mays]|uniref:Regulator of chromosome condensation (RCC1) family with FYVE zinc finger domain n=1 Tax=Zea mays TaxID=4577 RepID=A0A1D6E1U2_MAIZE|nr:PH, RCC1 and FYVE domains-containing protein 1 [Zea mays]ONM14644.1 Regulator of chromosome condensation (RCC1) family with FYVE zinc finger domain [Zea mays]|eukprot:XP_008668987.1 PH, RCC1 and FYVE domains-containing protein 1 isoform X2 [Zea mays]
MAGSFDLRTPTRGVEQAIVALKKGAHLLKCGKRGKPKFCAFRISSDETTLIWYSKGREKHLSLSSVSAVVLGQKTIKFLRQRCPEKEPHSFSLIYKNGERSLDLICSDRDQAENWYLGLRALLPTPCNPCSSIESRSSRQIDSCTNTPSSYIQLKSKLLSVHGTPRHIQVCSSQRKPKKAHGTFFGGSADCSESLFYTRQRTFSDIGTYLENLTRKMSNPEIHDLKDVMVGNQEKEQKITQTPKLKTFEGPRAACRLDSLKDVFFWGDAFGSILECGDTSKPLPMLVDSTNMLDVQSIACGETHAAIITKQGEVYSWGNESSGRIGNQVNIKVSRPKVVQSLASLHVKDVAYGSKHTCAVTVSGELIEWGEGPYMGQLDSYARNQWFPHKLFSPLDGISVVKIACGPWHTAIITSSGQLYTYGDGTFGVLGHGDTQGTTRPKEVESLKGSRVKCVACGPWHTAAIVEVISDFKSNSPRSKLFTWGDADRGKLGHADKKMKLIPTCVDSLTDYDFIQVSCGTALTVALSVTGVVFTSGSSMHGQLGNPHADGKTVSAVEGLLKSEFVRHISSGSSHVAVVTTNGKVFTWGKGKEGQLGLGDFLNRSTPTLVDALEGRHVESLSCGYNYTAAVCLHKVISRKDLSVCSGCKMAFGFTRKKHNCYHCGSMFCNSCSSNKVAKAALAPDKSRRYRVCDGCFSQLLKVVDSGKVKSELNTSKGAEIIRSYTPKLSRIFRDVNLPVEKEKVALVQRSNQRNEVLYTPVQAKSQRWGQVECPAQFLSAEDSSHYQSISKNHMYSASVSERMHDPTVLKSGRSLQQPNDDQRKDLNSIEETLLTEEVKQLRSQMTLLMEQYHQKALQVELYKQKLDETWLIVRNEAAKCKAAKDIIKVLTDQCKALSEKLLVGQQYENLETKSNISQGQTFSADLQHHPSEKFATGKFGQLDNTKNHQTSSQGDEEYTPSSSSDVQVEGLCGHLNGSRTFDSNGRITEGNSIVARVTSNGVIEQIERGVYVTFAVSPCGKKDIKRVRFSRKHFGEKEAQHWWEENKGSVYAKYSTEKAQHQLEVTIKSVQE